MRFAGIKAKFLYLGAAIALVLVVAFFMLGRATPSATAEEYLEALARGDANRLTELSFTHSGTKEQLLDAYKFATEQAGKNYSFIWRIKDEREADANTAAVQISVMRNANRATSYEENFEIPLAKKDGKWLVDVGDINDQMYPALPR